MARPQLTIYFDLVSPFAYITFYVVHNSKIFKQCDVTFVPAFLGGIMKYCNNTPPLNIKNKDTWINLERLRWASTFSVPMATEVPPGFPVKTLAPMRALSALSTLSPQHIPDAALALYTQLFVHRKSIEKPEDFMPVLEQVLGKELAGEILGAMGGKGKEVLQRNTDVAIEKGAFGMPWFVARDGEGKEECYWGFDHLGQVLAHLGVERGAGRAEEGWRSML